MYQIQQKLFKTFFAHPDNIRLFSQAPIVRKYINSVGQTSCLSSIAIDIGCGTGRYTKFLTQVSNFVVAIDPNFEALKRVRAKHIPAKLIQGEVEKLPFKSKSFSLALLLEVIEHIYNDKSGLKEINRILKLDKNLILSTPYPPPVYPDKLHKRVGYTKNQIFNLLKSSGFKPISYNLCMFWWSRILLKFAVNFMSIFKFPPPILPLLKIEKVLKRKNPFDIIVKAKTYLSIGKNEKSYSL
ncbi:class I SAM-dependent methyltransferase [candidate division WOR-3 bacterium]|nr:class I SAM-dependent methyltransferase [candidate division WOR-3 bacterium]